ncbi:acyltransferase [Pandoraea nosoerga]|uniref:Acyltransferase n=1 Tax=Pandoraea nosoerga TaxID=2508296 RepID=A0A5E4SMD7_9BURK|nr:acyltransferase [Pandoraea nosoerga]MBN4665300.1 acyltransferase [Pandoraea nosoerga]MBN4674700.1 acyltransferase [Pandoraea nosoerga]MBN4680589.1 acyltransferase [Pandoraea nosoerga]MBN4743994.1 acyltransferase [Pandoraea nosoerga]VVD75049.1 acyltransferase [Pandoraea nosoerga]
MALNPAHASPLRPRNDSIDLLRGLSILFVVVHHLALPFRLPLGPSLLGDVLPRRVINGLSFNGYEAVFVFFVISGFVITRRSLERYGSLDALRWRHFYALRAVRIFPLLLLLLAVLAVMHWLAVPGFVIDKPGQTLGGALASALTMTLNWYEGRTTWLPGAWDVLWSLSIEECFYLAFPLVCLVLRGRWRILALTALAISLPWTRAALQANEIWQEKAYLPGMAAIAWGVLTALAVQRVTLPRTAVRAMGALGVAGLVAVVFFGGALWSALHDGVMLVLCASAACWLAAAHGSTRAVPRAWQWLTQMGRWSYEIYLSHMFVVLAVTPAYLALSGGDMRWTFLVYPPVLIACTVLGGLLHRGVSIPAGRRLMRRKAAPGAANVV